MDVVFGDNLIKPRRLILEVNPEHEASRYTIMTERGGGGVGYQSENSLRTQSEWLEWVEKFRDEMTGRELREAIVYAKAQFTEPQEWIDARKRYADTGDAFIKGDYPLTASNQTKK